MADLLRVEDLGLTFESYEGTVYALNGVSLAVADGEVMGLVGETGCGKSVTMKTAMRLVPIPPARLTKGRILFRMDGRCPFCEGNGCTLCAGLGQFASCLRCSGKSPDPSCRHCFGTGKPYLDLLRLDKARAHRLRGRYLSLIFQGPRDG